MRSLPTVTTRRTRMRAARKILLNLRFLEVDMLAHDRVVLAHGHLLGLVARVLFGHIEEAGVGGADELDLDGCRLGHGGSYELENNKSGPRAAPLDRRAHWLQLPFLSS